jgi:excinuclease UvrABC nuclease subunit
LKINFILKGLKMESQEQTIDIPTIKLEWQAWKEWKDLEKHGNKKDIPTESGVYEVKDKDHQDGNRLYIGESGNLRRRIGYLLSGTHSAGQRIREDINNELIDKDKIKIRWAKTEYHCAAEEYLIKEHEIKNRGLPKYNVKG